MPALVSSQFAPHLLRELQKFRNEHFLCDCKLVVSVSNSKKAKEPMDENLNQVPPPSGTPATLEFPAHRLVLSAGSAFFWDLFNLRRHETMTTVNLNNCSPECLEVVLHFLYSGELQLGGCLPETVLNVAKVFQIHSLEQMLSPLAVSAPNGKVDGGSTPVAPIPLGSKRKHPSDAANFDDEPIAASSPGILKRLCQKHSLLSCAYCLPILSKPSDTASDASGPYVPASRPMPQSPYQATSQALETQSLEIQAAQAHAQFQMALQAAALAQGAAGGLAYQQALSGGITSLPNHVMSPGLAQSFSPIGTKSTSLSGVPMQASPGIGLVPTDLPVTRAGYLGPVLPTRSLPTSNDLLMSPRPRGNGLIQNNGITASPIFPPMVASKVLPSPYFMENGIRTPSGVGSIMSGSPRQGSAKVQQQQLLPTTVNSPGNLKSIKTEPQSKPTNNQGVTAAFSPDQKVTTPEQKSPGFEDNGIMVPSNDKEGWCRNKKYIEKVENGFKCTVCQKVYGRYNSVSYHVTIYHRNPPIRCDEAGCQFTTREARYIHFHKYYRHGTALPKTIDLAPRSCPFCRHVAKSPAMLEKHINRHVPDAARGAKGFKCRECGKDLATQRAMLEHMAAHTEEKNHQCDQCSYKGRTESNLRQHILFKHSSDLFKRKFVCDHCDYYCPTEGNLDAHKRRVHKMDIPRKRDKLGEPLYDDDLDYENDEDMVDSDLSPEPDQIQISPLSIKSLGLPRICEEQASPYQGAISLTEAALRRSFKLPNKRNSETSCSSGQDCVSPNEEDSVAEEEIDVEAEVLQAPPPSSASSALNDVSTESPVEQLLMTSGDQRDKVSDSGADESGSGTDLDDSHSNLASASTGYHSIVNYGTV